MLSLAAGPEASALWRVDTSAEWFVADDVQLWNSILAAEQVIAETRWRLELNADRVDLDYQPNEPIDPFGFSRHRTEGNLGSRLAWRRDLNAWRWELSGSAYDGFRSLSDVWIDEYYRQQYEDSPLPGVPYLRAEPHGYGGSATVRYEYLPATAYVSLVAGLYTDRVSPGYEIEDLGTSFELTRGESTLSTAVASLVFENALSSHLRMRHSLSFSDTSTRGARWGWTGDLNWFLGGGWVSRTSLSANRESPRFESCSVSQTFEYEVAERWFVSVSYRHYEDTGQIETANLVSSAAPALETEQWTFGVRWVSEELTTHFSLEAGPYASRYAPVGLGTERFRFLYQDRDWTFVRAAWHREF
jgi:hypothetical protein